MENVDRSWRNPNLLIWHGRLWLIDHGATLYFAHSWRTASNRAARAYDAAGHVLAPFVGDLVDRLAAADAHLAPRVTAALLDEVNSPRSTIVQTGPAHAGLTPDPAAEPERLLALLVR